MVVTALSKLMVRFGKGVLVANNAESARKAAKRMLDGQFGKSGNRIIIEEKILSWALFALSMVRTLS